MCGTISTARQAGGNACHAVRLPGTAVRIPPLADPQGNDVTGRWPLRSFLELGALPGAVPCARLHTRQLLWEWQLTGLADSAELVVSEIITNAIQVTQADARTAPVRLWLLADRARLADPGLGRQPAAPGAREHQRRRRERPWPAAGGHPQHTVGLLRAPPGQGRMGVAGHGMTLSRNTTSKAG